MSEFGLAKQLGFTRQQAQDYIKLYFARYPTVRAYMQATRTAAQNQGYITTILGRKLFTPDMQHPNRGVRQAAERAAINAPLQGSAAVSYTHLTLPTMKCRCRSRWSPYH